MNTTLVFAELLIIGIEGGIWLFFLFLSFFGVDRFDEFLSVIKDWQLVVLAVLLPLLYVVGIILDRIGDRLFKPRERQIEREIVGDLPVGPLVMRFSLGDQNENLNQQLDYARSRMRIIRASSINFIMISISISIFLLTRVTNISSALRWEYVAFTLFLGLLLAYASFLSWRFLIKGHLKLAKAMYEYQVSQDKSKKRASKKSQRGHRPPPQRGVGSQIRKRK